MAADELGIKERAALLVLMAEARELSNPELEEIVGFRLYGKELRKLTDRKLVESHKDSTRRGTLVHALTDNGWAWCAEEMAADRPRSRGAGGSAVNALSAVLRGMSRYLERSNLRLAHVFGPGGGPALGAAPSGDLEDRIRAAYRRLARDPGDWVSLTDLRRSIDGDTARDDLDAALRRMSRAQLANIVPQSNQKVLTPADREAAIRIGEQDNHLISIEEEP